MYKSKFSEASAKFRAAVEAAPNISYYFNLCNSLYQEGRFDDAMAACKAVMIGGAERGAPGARPIR